MSDLEGIKHEIIMSLDIISFYESYIDQRIDSFNNEWSKKLFCPIHDDTKTPNFAINRKTGYFKCFSCGVSGSVFDFWLIKNGYSIEDKMRFSEAIIQVGAIAGVDVKSKSKVKVREKKESKILKNKVVVERKTSLNDRNKKPIPLYYINELCNSLNSSAIKYLVNQRGLIKWSIDYFRIGFDFSWKYKDKETGSWNAGRFAIPVFNRDKECRNIRGYTNKTDPAFKMVNYVKNKGEIDEQSYGTPPRLFNLDKLLENNWEHVVICEGELDCILLCQKFYEAGMLDKWGAVCSTHGAESFEHEFADDLYGRNVYFLFDCDQEGKLAASSICSKYFLNGIRENKFKQVKIIDIPLEGTKDEKDITDYFIKLNMDFDSLLNLIQSVTPMIIGGVNEDEACHEPIKVNSLVEAVLDRDYIDKRIEVDLSITGTTSKIYHAVRSYEVSRCPLEDKEGGVCCSINEGVKTIPYGHPLFISSCMSSERKIHDAIADITCQKGQSCKIKVHEKVVMEQYVASQVLDRMKVKVNEETDTLESTHDLINIPVYVLQPKDKNVIEPVNYKTIGYIRTHPATGQAVYFIESYEKLEDNWTIFNIQDPVNKNALRELKENFTIDEIITDISNHVTFIYEAEEILYTVLLTYLCPLRFVFNGVPIRGWLNSAIMGDSGTGKSKTYLRISDWLDIGNVFSALTGSRTGFLYSIKRNSFSNDWNISIGSYVRASGTIIAIDEMQEMSKEDTKQMAIAMEDGKLRVEKVSSAVFDTRTRVLFLMNPKNRYGNAATVADFTYGCEALKYCFDPMFIRRLDVIVLTTGLHSHSFYNKKNEGDVYMEEGKVKANMIKCLIYWIWTRSKNQIKWEEESTDSCLEIATKMSEIFGYVDSIPAVNPQDFRETLARLSTSWAVLDRSISEDFNNLIVKPKHVKSAANFLYTIYSSEACALDKYSSLCKQRSVLESFDEIKESIEEVISIELDQASYGKNVSNFLKMLLMIEKLDIIRKNDLRDALGVNGYWVRTRIEVLQSLDLLVVNKYGIEKTRKFNLFMSRWKSDERILEMITKMNKVIYSEALTRMKSDDRFTRSEFHEGEENY